MKTIEIKSAKIRSGLFLTFSYEEKNEFKSEGKDFTKNDDIVNKSDLPMHDDCKQAFLNLIPHLILICELENSDEDNAFDAADMTAMEEDDDDFDIPNSVKDPKQIMQDLKKNLKKSGITMTISTSEDKGAA